MVGRIRCENAGGQMEPGVLDYRFPDTGLHRIRKIANALEQERVIEWGVVLLKLLVGIPLCLILPAIIVRLARPAGADPRLLFVAASAVIVPLLLILEKRHGSSYVWEQTQIAYDRFRLFRLSRYPTGDLTVGDGIVTLVFLIGPRFVLSAFDDLFTPEAETTELRILAGKIVAHLLDAGGAVPMFQLLPLDQDRGSLQKALHLLRRRGWVFISARRDRVSLAASIRKELANLA
jgi:hypothetical protein